MRVPGPSAPALAPPRTHPLGAQGWPGSGGRGRPRRWPPSDILKFENKQFFFCGKSIFNLPGSRW